MPGKALSKIAIIPARGGSKRLPRKNILDFLGKPIIAHTIDAAIESGLFGGVVVSTEDDAIADISKTCGARIVRRPPELATDTAGVTDVCLDVLKLECEEGRNWDIMTCLYATAPLRSAEDIVAVVERIVPGECEFAMAVSRYHLPPQQALKILDSGRLEPMWPEWIMKRSQDLPTLVVDNGSTYAVLREAFENVRSFYGPTLEGVEMPWERSVDIDTAEDIDLALYYAGKRFK